jgi:hypothetical protein
MTLMVASTAPQPDVEYDQRRNTEKLDAVFEARKASVIDEVAGQTNNEQLAGP